MTYSKCVAIMLPTAKGLTVPCASAYPRAGVRARSSSGVLGVGCTWEEGESRRNGGRKLSLGQASILEATGKP